jgi:hypothetical protein
METDMDYDRDQWRNLRNEWPTRPPAEPTDALPGTKAKLDVMIARVRRGEWPQHPDDAKGDSRDMPADQCLVYGDMRKQDRMERRRCQTTADATTE